MSLHLGLDRVSVSQHLNLELDIASVSYLAGV